MKFGQALELMNNGKKMQIPNVTGVCTLERDEKGKPVKILATGKSGNTSQAKLTHLDILSENWEIV